MMKKLLEKRIFRVIISNINLKNTFKEEKGTFDEKNSKDDEWFYFI